MKVTRTATVKLSVSPKERIILLRSLNAFTNEYNSCCAVGFEKHTNNGITLHKLTYENARKSLPSQLAISSRMMATDSLTALFSTMKKNPQKQYHCPHSKLMSIRLDKNSHTIWFNKSLVSVLTCEGRLRLPFKIHPYFQQFINWKHSCAQFCFKKNTFFLKVQFEKDVEDVPKSGKFIGIDRGIKKLAVTSDNRFFGGGPTRRICKRYQRIRSKLQKCGTKSAKRHLVRLSGQEKRFKSDVNHQISKAIVQCLNPGDTIVLEALSGIRNKRMRKKIRKEVNSWNFLQLENYITYKAEYRGIHIEHVNAAYTSLRCSKCGDIKRSNRKSQSCFVCRKCGFKLNADLNAARNIVLKHLDATNFLGSLRGYPDRAPVNEPNVAPVLETTNQGNLLVGAVTSPGARPPGG